MPRQIRGLERAELIPESPWPKKRARGSRSKGLAYERQLHKALRKRFGEAARCGQWIRFLDGAGWGHAQPDAYILRESDILLLEAKLSYRATAWNQMRGLYVPLLDRLYHRPIVCVQVTRFAGQIEEPKVATLDAAVDGSVLVWLGR